MLYGKCLMNAAEDVATLKIKIEEIGDELEKAKTSPMTSAKDRERIELAIAEIDTAIYTLMEALGHIYKAHHYVKPFLEAQDKEFSAFIQKFI